jgi:hypothetical protein
LLLDQSSKLSIGNYFPSQDRKAPTVSLIAFATQKRLLDQFFITEKHPSSDKRQRSKTWRPTDLFKVYKATSGTR